MREGFKHVILNAFTDGTAMVAGKEPTMIPLQPDTEPKEHCKESSSGVMRSLDIIPYQAEMERRGLPRGQYKTLQYIAGVEPKGIFKGPNALLQVTEANPR